MHCHDCGSELKKGAYYCTGCGQPVGFLATTTATDDADISAVPEPGPAVEKPPSARPAASAGPAEEAPRATKALCSLCMGSFPETVMSRVDGHAYCPDCSPLTARHTAPPAEPPRDHASSLYRSPYEPVRRPVLLTEETTSGGGRSRLIVAVVALLALAGAGVAAFSVFGKSRVDRMLSGLDTSSRPGRLLVQKYTPGERLTYGLKARLNGEMEASGGLVGQSGDGGIDATLFGTFSIDVLSVDSEGNAELQLTISNLDLTGKFDRGGMEQNLDGLAGEAFRELSNQRLVMRVDPFGKPIEPPAGSLGGMPGMDKMMGGQFADVPRRELSVGDEWTASERMDLGGASGFLPIGPGGISATYRVEGYKKVNGVDCMAISITGGMDDGGGMNLPGGSLEFGVDLEGVMFFDPEGGRLVKMAMDLAARAEGEGRGAGMSLDFTLEMDLELQ